MFNQHQFLAEVIIDRYFSSGVAIMHLLSCKRPRRRKLRMLCQSYAVVRSWLFGFDPIRA